MNEKEAILDDVVAPIAFGRALLLRFLEGI